MDSSSRPSSAKLFDVEDGYRKKLKETDSHRLHQRQKAIDKGKNTPAYENYLKVVPKETRPSGTSEDEKRFPRTPDKYEIASKRGWEGKVRAWRLRLHQYNPQPKEGEEVVVVPTMIPRDKRLGLQSPTKDSPQAQSKKRERDENFHQPASKRISQRPQGPNVTLPSPYEPLASSPSKEVPALAENQSLEEQRPLTEKKVSIFDNWSDDEVDDIGL